jgi:hypothetical protein
MNIVITDSTAYVQRCFKYANAIRISTRVPCYERVTHLPWAIHYLRFLRHILCCCVAMIYHRFIRDFDDLNLLHWWQDVQDLEYKVSWR